MNLSSKHLFTMALDVDPSKAHQIGNTAEGRRLIVPIIGGKFEGVDLTGTVEPTGYDWVRFRTDGAMIIDVRLVLLTDDGEHIYMSYQGRLLADKEVHKKMAQGQEIDPDEYSLVTKVSFETGAEKYLWLNDVIAIGQGRQSGYQPTYEVFAVGN